MATDVQYIILDGEPDFAWVPSKPSKAVLLKVWYAYHRLPVRGYFPEKRETIVKTYATRDCRDVCASATFNILPVRHIR